MSRDDLPMSTDTEEQRRQEVVDMGQNKSDGVVDKLIVALGDTSWRVRKAALDSLMRHEGHGAIVPALVKCLASDDNAGMRNASAEALTRIGAAAVPELLRQLSTPDVDLQKFAIDVLGEIASPQAVPGLISALDADDENVRAAAAEALGKIGSIEAIDALWRRALSSNDLLLKLSALEALARIGAPGPFEQLAELTKNRFVARAAYALLAVCPDPRAIELLVEGITASAKSQRASALLSLVKRLEQDSGTEEKLVVEALGERRSAAVQALVELLKNDDKTLARAAIRMLGLAGEPSVARSVLESLDDDSLFQEAERALSQLGPEAQRHIAEALPSLPDEARELGASLLAQRGDPRAVRLLIDSVLGSESRMREIAAKVLADLGAPGVVQEALDALGRADEESLPLLEEILKGAVARFKHEAHQVIASRVGTTTGAQAPILWRVLALVVTADDLPLLLGAMRDEREAVRAAAVEGLTILRGPEALNALLLCLSDEAAAVRRVVSARLAHFTEDRVRDALIVATQDHDVDVATTAAQSLGHFGDEVTRTALVNLLKNDRSQVVIAALGALAASARDALVEWLPYLLSHRDVEVIKECTRLVLPEFAGEAKKYAESLLTHPQWDVRYVAATTLGKVSSVRDTLQARAASEPDQLVKAALNEALQGGNA